MDLYGAKAAVEHVVANVAAHVVPHGREMLLYLCEVACSYLAVAQHTFTHAWVRFCLIAQTVWMHAWVRTRLIAQTLWAQPWVRGSYAFLAELPAPVWVFLGIVVVMLVVVFTDFRGDLYFAWYRDERARAIAAEREVVRLSRELAAARARASDAQAVQVASAALAQREKRCSAWRATLKRLHAEIVQQHAELVQWRAHERQLLAEARRAFARERSKRE